MPVPRFWEPPAGPNPASLGKTLAWALPTWLRYLLKSWPTGGSACLSHPSGIPLGMPGPDPTT